MTIALIRLSESSQQFLQLMGRVLLGEEIIIWGNAIAVVILPSSRKRQPRVAGQDKDKIFIASDFNEPYAI